MTSYCQIQSWEIHLISRYQRRILSRANYFFEANRRRLVITLAVPDLLYCLQNSFISATALLNNLHFSQCSMHNLFEHLQFRSRCEVEKYVQLVTTNHFSDLLSSETIICICYRSILGGMGLEDAGESQMRKLRLGTQKKKRKCLYYRKANQRKQTLVDFTCWLQSPTVTKRLFYVRNISNAGQVVRLFSVQIVCLGLKTRIKRM